MNKSKHTQTLRINAFISRAGITSRRKADELIEKGHVKVNGTLLVKPGTQVNPRKDVIEVKMKNGTWKKVSEEEDTVIYALYKPRGYVTSMKVQGSSPIIRSLLPKKHRVFPVGRLDKESEGLLICTNDGDLAFKLTHPKTHIEKTYLVHCTFPKTYTENKLKSHLGRIAKGVRLDGRKTLPMDIELVRYLRPQMVELKITLREGRYRQIRRSLGKIHLEVQRLIRTRIGKLDEDILKLKHGEYIEVKVENIL